MNSNASRAIQRMRSQRLRDGFVATPPLVCREVRDDQNRMAHVARGHCHWTELRTWQATEHYLTHGPWHWQLSKLRGPSLGQRGRQNIFLEIYLPAPKRPIAMLECLKLV